ncbi:MAG TPA: hypothetical protein VF427_10275 [Noviherbaspirillum sp.]
MQQYHSAIAVLLALVLLFAQWCGLSHRIAHAPHLSAIVADDNGDAHAHHSCTSFDAAAAGDTIHLAPFVAPLLTSAHTLALWAAFISWDAPPVPYFSSRAPPLA